MRVHLEWMRLYAQERRRQAMSPVDPGDMGATMYSTREALERIEAALSTPACEACGGSGQRLIHVDDFVSLAAGPCLACSGTGREPGEDRDND